MLEYFQNHFTVPSLMGMLEFVAVGTALIYVYLASKEKAICFIFGFISSAIYVYICWVHKLYFDTIINLYYIVMSVVGWNLWKQSKKTKSLKIGYLGKKRTLIWCAIGLLIVFATGSIAKFHTDASLPYIDSFTTVFALIATLMVVKKHIENWILFIFIDGVSIWLYYYKELYLTSLLFSIYTIIAIRGYLLWKKNIEQEQ